VGTIALQLLDDGVALAVRRGVLVAVHEDDALVLLHAQQLRA
jgi:hypothetical protein